MIQSQVHKTTLDNGLVVLTETIPNVRSVSLGIWVCVGSRHETQAQNGISHFIEHAVFKGTPKRTARQIAVQADILGGSLDAFTSQEVTNFYIKVLDSHLPKAFELLADIVTNPSFDSVEIEKERNVILEEIKMVDDTPDELVYDLFAASFWPNHPLGRPIQGTTESVSSFTNKDIVDFYKNYYHPKNILIVAAGNLSHQQLVDLSNQYFGHLEYSGNTPIETMPTVKYEIAFHKKPNLEQTHIILATSCPPLLAPEHYTCNVLNNILGGGLSSRLFQTIREEHGLAYTVFSSTELFRDVGCLSIYLAVSNKQVRKAIDFVLQEITNLKEHMISLDELSATKEQLKTSLLLSCDSISSRMNNLAQNEIFFGKQISIEEIISEIEKVTQEEILELTQTLFQKGKIAATILGTTDKAKLDFNFN